MKMPAFVGKTSFTTHFIQFQRIAEDSGRSNEEKALVLVASLLGDDIKKWIRKD